MWSLHIESSDASDINDEEREVGRDPVQIEKNKLKADHWYQGNIKYLSISNNVQNRQWKPPIVPQSCEEYFLHEPTNETA